MSVGLPLFALGATMAVAMGVWLYSLLKGDDLFTIFLALMIGFTGLVFMREALRILRGIHRTKIVIEPSTHHLERYARSALHPHGTPPEPAKCAAVVRERWQCDFPRGHGPEGAFCVRHAKEHAASSNSP